MNWYFKVILSQINDQVNLDPSQDIDRGLKYKTLDQVDADKVYDLFSDSYQKATGKAWDRGKFISRAGGWRFYGDENGYVTVREQRSGMLKLTAVAGAPRSIIRGMQDLMSEGKPVWGMVDKNIQSMAQRFGLKSPPGALVKMLIGKIPSNVFGGATLKGVGWDGGATFDYADIGETTKYLIGNTEYYQLLLNDSRLPAPARWALKKMV